MWIEYLYVCIIFVHEQTFGFVFDTAVMTRSRSYDMVIRFSRQPVYWLKTVDAIAEILAGAVT